MARKAAAEKDLTEERQAMAERALSSAGRQSAGGGGGGGGGSPADGPAASTWWVSHFGASAGEAVAFERMRAAAEVELGPLSSVDVQLLRLELSDERGKLTKAAIKVCAAWLPYDSTYLSYAHPPSLISLSQRLLSGSIDGSDGHETVGGALRALLQAARAQLDKQVEVRMKQAAARTSSQGNQRLSPNRDMGKSPSERRVRLGDL